jgi:hypothetical protein
MRQANADKGRGHVLLGGAVRHSLAAVVLNAQVQLMLVPVAHMSLAAASRACAKHSSIHRLSHNMHFSPCAHLQVGVKAPGTATSTTCEEGEHVNCQQLQGARR